MKKGYDVYAKVDVNNNIVQIGSNVFISNFEGWTLIEENVLGNRGAHAQSQYLPKGLIDVYGRYNYKLVNNTIVEIKDEEKEIIKTVNAITVEQRLEALEAAILEMVLGGAE